MTIKTTLPLSRTFFIMGLRFSSFEVIKEACLATLLEPNEEVRKDGITSVLSSKILPPDYRIKSCFVGDNGVYVVLESQSLRKRVVADVCDLDPKYRGIKPNYFQVEHT
ncbi:MAG TPA: hypothetical protein VJH20_05390 [Candidatus Nanoarchaeia archaeon]|nr:hypothetical protein [Candidatus Nanoarchaeia archaeon]